MSRTRRLFDLLQTLRRHRRPVSAQKLAAELNVSLRTVYRDIQMLTQQGAHIEGEAGVGYVLRPGFVLPPLMFSNAEIEALVLGSRWVAQCTDKSLALAARNALAKIATVLPEDLRAQVESSPMLVGPAGPLPKYRVEISLVRQAIEAETRVSISYSDAKSVSSRRSIWPIALAFFERVRVLVAWCEERQAFRHFRLDRLNEWTPLEERYPRRRKNLLREWRAIEGLNDLM
jgi:predicted DNA-binding transcriptional regulator YafY